MVLIYVTGIDEKNYRISVHKECHLHSKIASDCSLDPSSFYLTTVGGLSCPESDLEDGDSVHVKFKVEGGIDFQHREGSKVSILEKCSMPWVNLSSYLQIGSGGLLSESQAAIERKERLRKLALESIDISKDPYIMKNNSGTYEVGKTLCFWGDIIADYSIVL